MRLNRFIIDQPLSAGLMEVTDTQLVNQIKNVLRLGIGDSVLLCDGQGNEVEAAIEEISRHAANFTTGTPYKVDKELARDITLCLAVLKNEHFSLAIEKATELGVKRIIPMITKRTVKIGINPERVKRILREATEQCGRGIVPEISEPMSLKEALAAVSGTRVFGTLAQDAAPLSDLSSDNPLAVYVGPEGGWEPEEEKLLAKDATPVALGPRTLRAETAAIAAMAIISQ